MFKKILVPLDGSENAERALPWAKRYAGPPKAQVVLVRAIRPSGDPDEWFGPALGVDEACEYLQRIERELNYSGIPTKTIVKEGATAATIVQVARKEGCGLILMTTRGGSKVARWVIGGVTEQVMRLSDIPVLVVRSQSHLSRQGRISRIVVPMDGSELAESILPWAEQLARFHRAPLEFIHVCPPGKRAEQPRYEENLATFRRHVRQAAEELRARGVKASLRVERGDAAEEILRKIGQTDLIAMTTHGYGGFKRWVLGSVAEKVIHAGVVPVFIYRSPAPARKGTPIPPEQATIPA